MDELIAALRTRASDPERRVDVRPTVFMGRLGAMDVGQLMQAMRGIQGQLGQVVAANQAGRVDPRGHAMADVLAQTMGAPAPMAALPAPAGAAAVSATEAALGVAFPPFLRRVYTEIADGGFGPGEGLYSLAGMERRTAELRRGDELPRGRHWPASSIPLAGADPAIDCLDAATGRVVTWDPEGLAERSSEDRFQRSFRQAADTVEEWLRSWLMRPTPEELMAEQVRAANVKAAREARASIGAMTPEQRAKMGLPEVGWEKVVWGGLGLEEDDEPKS